MLLYITISMFVNEGKVPDCNNFEYMVLILDVNNVLLETSSREGILFSEHSIITIIN